MIQCEQIVQRPVTASSGRRKSTYWQIAEALDGGANEFQGFRGNLKLIARMARFIILGTLGLRWPGDPIANIVLGEVSGAGGEFSAPTGNPEESALVERGVSALTAQDVHDSGTRVAPNPSVAATDGMITEKTENPLLVGLNG